MKGYVWVENTILLDICEKVKLRTAERREEKKKEFEILTAKLAQEARQQFPSREPLSFWERTFGSNRLILPEGSDYEVVSYACRYSMWWGEGHQWLAAKENLKTFGNKTLKLCDEMILACNIADKILISTEVLQELS